MPLFIAEQSAEAFWATLPQIVAEFQKAHPVASVFAVLIIVFMIGASFWKPWEMIPALIERRRNAVLEGERDAAKELVEDLTSASELYRLTLDVARDTVERASRLRPNPPIDEVVRALAHVGDWTQRLFGFLESDINKVALWVPDGRGDLRIVMWTGITPEAVRQIRVPIQQAPPRPETFAAMAFRGNAVFVCSDTDNDPRYQPLERLPAHPYKSIIAAPVLVGGGPVGVLTVDSLRRGHLRRSRCQAVGTALCEPDGVVLQCGWNRRRSAKSARAARSAAWSATAAELKRRTHCRTNAVEDGTWRRR